MMNPGKFKNFRSCFKFNLFDNILHSSFYFKPFMLLVGVFIITVLGITYQLEKNIEQVHIGVVKDELCSLAAIAAFHIDGNLVNQLQKPEQEGSEQYQSLQKTVMQLKQTNKQIDDLYIMRKGPDQRKLYFVVNAYGPGVDHVSLGEPYDLSQAPEMLQGFHKPVVDSKVTTDKWGQMLSGYAPLRNTKGQIVGIVGVDFAANDIQSQFKYRSMYVFFYVMLGMLLFLGISLILTKNLVGRLNNIKHGIDMILEERLDVLIRDTGNDEIKGLAQRLNQLVQKLVNKKQQMFIHSTIGLVNALEARDPYTYGHSSEVALITKDIINALQIDPDMQFIISFAAGLHDIGKIGISDTILNKPGKLTDEEFSIIKQHPVIGEKILEGIPSLEEIRDIVRHHHERYDGKGYPDGLMGENIHLGARIITVADSFQAIISDRPYRKGLTEEAALQELEKNKGSQFDPVIVNAFLEICQKKKYKK